MRDLVVWSPIYAIVDGHPEALNNRLNGPVVLKQLWDEIPSNLAFLAQIFTKSFSGWAFAPDPTGKVYIVCQIP